MEDTLRVSFVYRKKDGSVLILVLMEDTLRETLKFIMVSHITVLILVLMEDTLRAWSTIHRSHSLCLNPCFNGRYSQSPKHFQTLTSQIVLILVLMEDTLREQRLVSLCLSSFDVCLPL